MGSLCRHMASSQGLRCPNSCWVTLQPFFFWCRPCIPIKYPKLSWVLWQSLTNALSVIDRMHLPNPRHKSSNESLRHSPQGPNDNWNDLHFTAVPHMPNFSFKVFIVFNFLLFLVLDPGIEGAGHIYYWAYLLIKDNYVWFVVVHLLICLYLKIPQQLDCFWFKHRQRHRLRPTSHELAKIPHSSRFCASLAILAGENVWALEDQRKSLISENWVNCAKLETLAVTNISFIASSKNFKLNY